MEFSGYSSDEIVDIAENADTVVAWLADPWAMHNELNEVHSALEMYCVQIREGTTEFLVPNPDFAIQISFWIPYYWQFVYEVRAYNSLNHGEVFRESTLRSTIDLLRDWLQVEAKDLYRDRRIHGALLEFKRELKGVAVFAEAFNRITSLSGSNSNTVEPTEVDARNKWIYEAVQNLDESLTAIRVKLNNTPECRNKSWRSIGTDPGIMRAAKRYAERHKLTMPPKRKIN